MRLSHSRPASSGDSQHGACSPAISSSTAAATSGAHGRDLVALARAGDVLHEEREPSGLGLDLGGVHGRQPGADPGGDLAVEADLYLVGPQRQPGAAALVVGRGELAHHAGRARRRAGRRSRVKRVVSAIWPVPIGAVSKDVTGAVAEQPVAATRTPLSHSGVTSVGSRSRGGAAMGGRDYCPAPAPGLPGRAAGHEGGARRGEAEAPRP